MSYNHTHLIVYIVYFLSGNYIVGQTGEVIITLDRLTATTVPSTIDVSQLDTVNGMIFDGNNLWMTSQGTSAIAQIRRAPD